MCAHLGVFEQVAKVGDIAQDRDLIDRYRVLRLDYSADDDRATVSYQHLRSSLLSQQGWVALNFVAEIWGCILHIYVQEDSSF